MRCHLFERFGGRCTRRSGPPECRSTGFVMRNRLAVQEAKPQQQRLRREILVDVYRNFKHNSLVQIHSLVSKANVSRCRCVIASISRYSGCLARGVESGLGILLCLVRRAANVGIANETRPSPGSLALNRNAERVFTLVVQIQIFHVVDEKHDLPDDLHDWGAEESDGWGEKSFWERIRSL